MSCREQQRELYRCSQRCRERLGYAVSLRTHGARRRTLTRPPRQLTHGLGKLKGQQLERTPSDLRKGSFLFKMAEAMYAQDEVSRNSEICKLQRWFWS